MAEPGFEVCAAAIKEEAIYIKKDCSVKMMKTFYDYV